jgi:glycosyltransferase involved in cell wall biosynthesis
VGVLNHFASTDRPFVLGALKRNPINYYRVPGRISAHIVHYHHSHWLAFMALVLGKRGGETQYIITLHGTGLARRLNSRMPLVGRITRWGLRRFDAIIVVNEHIRDAIQQHVGTCELDVLPAFLPPLEEPPYQTSIEKFLSLGTTLLVPVYRVQFLPDGRDLYGLDTAVEAFVALAPHRPELRLACFIAERPRGRKASTHLSSLVGRLERAQLKDRARIVYGVSLVPAFRHDVIVVRAARSEGDAVSVREAISSKVPVIASDVVDRPRGAITFTTGDSIDLCRAISIVLERPKIANEHLSVSDSESDGTQFLAPLIRIYRSQLEAKPKAF